MARYGGGGYSRSKPAQVSVENRVSPARLSPQPLTVTGRARKPRVYDPLVKSVRKEESGSVAY